MSDGIGREKELWRYSESFKYLQILLLQTKKKNFRPQVLIDSERE